MNQLYDEDYEPTLWWSWRTNFMMTMMMEQLDGDDDEQGFWWWSVWSNWATDADDEQGFLWSSEGFGWWLLTLTLQTLERAWVDFLRGLPQETSLLMAPPSNRSPSPSVQFCLFDVVVVCLFFVVVCGLFVVVLTITHSSHRLLWEKSLQWRSLHLDIWTSNSSTKWALPRENIELSWSNWDFFRRPPMWRLTSLYRAAPLLGCTRAGTLSPRTHTITSWRWTSINFPINAL